LSLEASLGKRDPRELQGGDGEPGHLLSLAGSGVILELTVTPKRDLLTFPITFTAKANEGRIRLVSARFPTKGTTSHADQPHR